ncbi:acetyl esterase/lipase [Larkinella arboricola]|uniref:Acetyl esterase/lipase n=1 Tax=Larkinella arboricola TaxID=643671 RepID=A0A327WZF1_LARAB|nr:alpha/beta hydrolase [Larkinella arboricola]RAJ97795.1 acetyl esterase/lipase [Larkinella arboricola]
MPKTLLLSLALTFTGFLCLAQQEIPLYPGSVPNAKTSDVKETKRSDQVVLNVVQPTLSIFLPPKEKATGAAVVICPGGGYGVLVMKREGYDVAEAFTKMGVAAFVLKYRLPNEKTMIDPSIGPLQDAQQALKTVRQRAKEWGVDSKKIGIMGFSAGGHLAATAGTHFKKPVIDNPETVSVRPDFMILIYPVISFRDEIGHSGSRKNLLGASPKPEQVTLFSNELQVDESTPPAFLTHAGDDTVVPVKNSLIFYEALQKKGVSADLHLYTKGEHGYLKTPAFEEWFGRIRHWMNQSGLLTP